MARGFGSVMEELERGAFGDDGGSMRRHVPFYRSGRGSRFPEGKEGDPEREAALERAREEHVDRILREFNGMVGLRPVKRLVGELRAYLAIQKKRDAAGLWSASIGMHMIFTGNPGTGKTTVARVLGRIFSAMGVLDRGHVVEVERADLVGEYIGHTAHRTREQLQKAVGGVLFIDEAYSLIRGGEKDFGREAIDALVKGMEDGRDRLIVILAGYPREMEAFLAANPGLRSRFPVHMEFPDYTAEELIQIADVMCREKDYRLTEGARRHLRWLIATHGDRLPGNARDVRNLLERAMRRQAVRLHRRSFLSEGDLMELCGVDFDGAVTLSEEGDPEENGFPFDSSRSLAFFSTWSARSSNFWR